MRLSFLVFLIAISGYAQSPSPATPQEKAILVKNITIHDGRGNEIKNGVIYFDQGNLVYVGSSEGFSVRLTEFEEIDGNGGEAYPGFIALDNTLGLTEINAVRASNDHSELGEFNASLRSIIAYNTDSEVIPTIRSNGTLLSQPAPSAGTVCGQSSIVQLDAWNWEDAVVKEGDAIFVNYPDINQFSWWMDEKQKAESKKRKLKNLDELHKFFADAKAYSELEKPNPKNLNLEAMKGLFDGSKNLFLRTNNAKAITDAVLFAKKYGIKKIVIRGGKEAYAVKDFLKENNVSVVLYKMHLNPSRSEDDVDIIFRQPAILEEAGIDYCISYDRGHDGQRNLGFVAGSAVAYGLDYEKAISAITYNAAVIVGIDEKYGSLENGKSATFFISQGDALDMLGNDVTYAFIDGRRVDLNDKQKELANKYSEKYGIE